MEKELIVVGIRNFLNSILHQTFDDDNDDEYRI